MTGGMIALGLLLFLVFRHPLAVVMAAVSLIIMSDYGTAGLVVFWGILLAIAVAREASRSERNHSDRVR